MLNKGATKGQIAWRWLELNPAPVQESVFQLLQWSLLEFCRWCRATLWQCSIFYLFWWCKCWIKVVPKGKLLKDDLNSTLHQSRKVYFNFCNVACWIKVLPKGRSPEDDLKSTLHQSRIVYFTFCNESCCNLANDTEYNCSGSAFFNCFGLWTFWIKVLPKGKLPEDDLNSTLSQFRKVYFTFCNGSCCNLANDAEQHCGGAAFLPFLGYENSE